MLHTAVWTGGEMVVWGGFFFSNSVGNVWLNSGGKYNPSTDSWTATSTTNAPVGRDDHTAVWTGSQMIVWGGFFHSGSNSYYLNTGGRYNPDTDAWAPTKVTNAPNGREAHSAVWTGGEMIVWGGLSESVGYFNTGGRYDPGTDKWTVTSTTNAPVGRYLHTAIWTGSEMIIWGGYPITSTGGRYIPGTDSWTATSTTNGPTSRGDHTAVWTGDQMIVWGGNNNDVVINTGGRYCAQPSNPSPTPTQICANPVTIFSESFDGVTPPTLPDGWVATNAIDPDGILWVSSTSGGPTPIADSEPTAAFVNESTAISDKRLDSPSILIPGPSAQLTFSNNYNLAQFNDEARDAGVLEISIGEGEFTDIVAAGGSFVTGGYNWTISTRFGNPMAGRRAWSGNSGGFITTVANLPAAAAQQNVRLRWRMGTDNGNLVEGWRIDSIVVVDCPPTPTPAPINISGTISYCSNPVPGPVPNVTLTLTGSASGSTLSDGSGNYTFSSLPSGGTYTVTPTKSALTPGSAGINTVDVIATQRHFLNHRTPSQDAG